MQRPIRTQNLGGARAVILHRPHETVQALTRRLLAAVPVPDPTHVRPPTQRLAGDVPSPIYPLGQGPARTLLTDIGDGHLVALDAMQTQSSPHLHFVA